MRTVDVVREKKVRLGKASPRIRSINVKNLRIVIHPESSKEATEVEEASESAHW